MLDRIAGLMENLRQVTTTSPMTCARRSRICATAWNARAASRHDGRLRSGAGSGDFASDEILTLFAALLRIAQIEGGVRRGGFAPLDLSALLHHLREVFDPVAEDAGHAIKADIDAGVTIRGDRDLLAQLFSNLIENAIVHTPPGTAITLEARMQDGRAIATVSDDGPGVPAEEHAKLFQRLYRREASRPAGLWPGAGAGRGHRGIARGGNRHRQGKQGLSLHARQSSSTRKAGGFRC